MEFEIQGNPDYGEVDFRLGPGEKLLTEGGAMSRMSVGLGLATKILGGWMTGLGRKLFGGESLFIAVYGDERGGELTLAPSMPGSLLHRRLEGESLNLTSGAFVACTPGIDLRTRFGGIRYLFSGEGAFFLACSGSGDLFFNCYGAVIEKEVDGTFVLDTGHLVAWEPSLEYQISGMGGIKQTLFSGEGLVMRFKGRGKVWVQTRTLPATATWLSPFLAG